MMAYLALREGDTIPLTPRRRPFGAACLPAWYAFTVPPLREVGAGAWLCKNGAAETWFPVQPERKWNRWRREFIVKERKVAPGYVFAWCDRTPNWDVLFAEAGTRINGVVSLRSGRPMPISAADWARMKQVPQHIEEELRRLREQEEALREAERPVVGEPVELLGGLAGTVIAERVEHGRVWFTWPNGAPGSVSAEQARRVPLDVSYSVGIPSTASRSAPAPAGL